MYVLVEGAIERYLGYFEERSIPGDYGITVSLNVAVAQLEDLAMLNIDNVWAGKPLALNRHGAFGLPASGWQRHEAKMITKFST